MKESIILRTSLDLDNPLFVLSSPEKNILNILKDKFEKKCHKSPDTSNGPKDAAIDASFYVEEVLEIVSHTEPQVSQLGSNTLCSINNIEFRVQAMRCIPGEILNGCIVNSKVKNSGVMYLMKSPCVYIFVKLDNDSDLIAEGKNISIVVNKAVHTVGKSLITINGIPLFGSIKTPAYKINKQDFSQNDANALKNIYSEKFNDIKSKIDTIKESDNDHKRMERLRDHLYGSKDFNERKKVPTGVTVVPINSLMDFSKIKSGWYFRGITRDMDSEDVFFCEDEQSIPAGISKETRIKPRDAFSALLRHYYQGMVTIQEWTYIYAGEMEKSHSNLWRIMDNNKV